MSTTSLIKRKEQARNYGIMGLWDYGIMGLWGYGIIKKKSESFLKKSFF